MPVFISVVVEACIYKTLCQVSAYINKRITVGLHSFHKYSIRVGSSYYSVTL